ncbi:hypothetical protein ACHMZP_31895 [Rhodococcus baikonurensis]|uniref:hypothetical protein n=1 Tax=Rhodococcus baikonurensis TaxID=172041 RepID=UPI0037B98E49
MPSRPSTPRKFIQPADLWWTVRAVSDDHQFVILTRPNPEGEGVIYTIIDNNRGVRGPASISGNRLRNRRSDSPIPQRPRRRKIGSQPPAIEMGADAHRRGTATRESAERRRRAAMTTTSPYLSCNGRGITTEENENGCAEIESVLKLGWTQARDESYCPICADVRSQTWPDTEATEEKAEPMIPRETPRVRETTIRAGVAGIAGGFALATIFLAFTPYLAGVACGVFLAVVSAVALAILCAPEIRRETKTRRPRDRPIPWR